ncbi:serine/arginine repetitive matrix protein 1 [Forsythia ovata]|uniref:Serine/arginine repetitive matrix protein 1 n=1 Tax=Forsythia ovata TaxID=205694 RepID=A0ABD1VJF5_9LAMI
MTNTANLRHKVVGADGATTGVELVMEEDSYEPNVEIIKDGYLALRTTLEGKARIENDVHAPLSYARDLIDGFCIGVQMATGNSEAINKENYLFPLLANDVEGKMVITTDKFFYDEITTKNDNLLLSKVQEEFEGEAFEYKVILENIALHLLSDTQHATLMQDRGTYSSAQVAEENMYLHVRRRHVVIVENIARYFPRACSAPSVQKESLPSQSTEVSEKLIDSAEWSRQKEEKLNKLLMKMMETKSVNYRNVVPDKSKSDKFPNEQRGGQYNHYKEKRAEKLRGETTRKQVEKEKQFRAMQHILDSRKVEMASPIVSQAGKVNNIKKVQKPQKNLSQSTNPKSESTNSGVMKKAVSKSSSLPATRKLWPSAPLP